MTVLAISGQPIRFRDGAGRVIGFARLPSVSLLPVVLAPTFVALDGGVEIACALPAPHTTFRIRSSAGRTVILSGPGPHVVNRGQLTPDPDDTSLLCFFSVPGGVETAAVVPMLNGGSVSAIRLITPGGLQWSGRALDTFSFTVPEFSAGKVTVEVLTSSTSSSPQTVDGTPPLDRKAKAGWFGKWVEFAAWVPDASQPGGRLYWRSGRIECVQAGPNAALTASDVVIVDSEYVGSSTVDFSPRVAFPGLKDEIDAGLVNRIVFRASPPDWTGSNPFNACSLISPAAYYTDGQGTQHRLWKLDSVTLPGPPPMDPSKFQKGSARLKGRLRFSWASLAGQPLSPESPTFEVPEPSTEPDLPVPLSVWQPSNAAIVASMSKQHLRFYRKAGDEGGGNCNFAFAPHCPLTIAQAALAGDTNTYATPYGTITPKERLILQLKFWASTSQNNAPPGNGGFRAQFEVAYVSVLAVSKLIPGIWTAQGSTPAALSAAEQERLTVAALGVCASSAAHASTRYPWHRDGFGVGKDRDTVGFSANLNGVTNFQCSALLIPYVTAAFYGTENLKAFFAGFDRTAFHKRISDAGGNPDLKKTFSKDWNKAAFLAEGWAESLYYGDGPTEAQLEACLNTVNGVPWRQDGLYSLDDVDAVVVRVLNRAYSAKVSPGATKAGGGWLGGEWGPAAPWRQADGGNGPYGVKNTSGTYLRGCVGRLLSNGQRDKSAWAGIPYPGEMGMPDEFDTVDGGAKINGVAQPAARSSMTYVAKGLVGVLIGVAALAMCGRIDPKNANVVAAFRRMKVGEAYCRYCDEHGHGDYAKGAATNSSDEWNRAWANDKGFVLENRYAASDALEAWMAAS